MASSHFESPAPGITVIDTAFQRPGFAASYLLVENGRAAYIDTGHNAAVPTLLTALDETGLRVEDVDYVIVTHVHLDHAGGAGLLFASMPNATFVVHPRGARHMVDPSKLMAGAAAVYGEEEVARTYGTLLPVPADRVLESHDGMTIDLAGRTLEFIDTPGHARHHHCVWDERTRGWFTGDTHGVSYRELIGDSGRFMFPTTTPVQFDPAAAHASLDRLAERDPAWLYLTHFGEVAYQPGCTASLHEQLDEMVAIARKHAEQSGDDRHSAVVEDLTRLYLAGARQAGIPLSDADLIDLLAMDLELNAQGLEVWLDQQAG